MAVAFPTLSVNAPRIDSFRETISHDPTLRSTMESGKVLTRARFTATKKKWEFTYRNLIEADKILLDAFEQNTMVGSEVITWTHPKTLTGYSVKLAEPIRFSLQSTDKNLWEASFIFIED